MNKKIYWGLGVLILLFASFMVYVQYDYVKFKKGLEKDHPKADVVADGGNEKVTIDDPSPPIEHPPVQITEVSQQMPVVNAQTEKKRESYADEGKPIDEDFYRKNYSREQLKVMIKSGQKVVETLKTVYVPDYEKYRAEWLEHLRNHPENESFKKYLTEVEENISFYKTAIKGHEKSIAMMSNVLNNEVNHDEK